MHCFLHTDYYPFGMLMPNRHGQDDDYRYGFAGRESDKEIDGKGGIYNFGARMLDSRIGRWFRTDDYEHVFATSSPYSYAFNSPILFQDFNGDFPVPSSMLYDDWLCAVTGGIAGGVSEFGFQVFDRMIFEGDNFKAAIGNVDWSDIITEAGVGALSGCFTNYTVARISRLFKGKYKAFSYYMIKEGLEVTEDVLNNTLKDWLNGEPIELGEYIKNVIGEKLMGEIMSSNPFKDMRKIGRAGKKVRKQIKKAKKYDKKAKKWKKKLANETDDQLRSKYRRKMEKFEKKRNKAEKKAIERTFGEYKKFADGGGEFVDELRERAESKVKSKIYEEIITFGPLQQGTTTAPPAESPTPQ